MTMYYISEIHILIHISTLNPVRRPCDNTVLYGNVTATSHRSDCKYNQSALLNLSTGYKQNGTVIVNTKK